LSEQDAAESGDDLPPGLAGRRRGPGLHHRRRPERRHSPFVNTTNIRELYDWKPGESLDEAIARKKAQEG
jgi:nucleoside-diphosphate-sugar epimerase